MKVGFNFMAKDCIKIKKGDNGTFIVVVPATDIKKMNPESSVLVNRVRINSKVMEYQKSGVTDCEVEKLLVNAMKNIGKQESQQSKTSIGVKMKIKDVLKLFAEPEKMHDNSFFLLEKG